MLFRMRKGNINMSDTSGQTIEIVMYNHRGLRLPNTL